MDNTGIITLFLICLGGISYTIYQISNLKKQLKEFEHSIDRLNEKLNHEREVLENSFVFNLTNNSALLKKEIDNAIENIRLENMQRYVSKKSDSDIKYY